MIQDEDLRVVESLGKLPAAQRTPRIVSRLLSPKFIRDHPTLVRMLSSTQMDAEILELMLDRVRHVRQGHENVHDASVDVGAALAKTYFPEAE